MPSRSTRQAVRRHVVTAVLVNHDGSAWLSETLAGLAAQTRAPEHVVGVDTGSTDGSHDALAAAVSGSLVTLPADTGFGAAVAAGLEAASREDAGAVEWVWLLHDDSAPDPTALQELLALAEDMPSAGVIGPKCRRWDGRHLSEVGITTDLVGRRDTGLERREVDQGQHDLTRDVLAVNTAGALIRRDVWDRLGGLDPALPLLRDDLDFGWRANRAGARVVVAPAAVVRHAEATASGLRSRPAAGRRLHRLDRTAALYTVLTNISAPALLIAVPRLLVGGLLRALGFLLIRRPSYAVDEVAALASVLGRPMALRAARHHRAQTSTVAHRDIRHLLAGLDVRFRSLADMLRRGGAADGESEPTASARSAVPVETGPVSEEAENFLAGGTGWLRHTLTRPPVALFLVLSVVALIAGRHLLGGSLAGGRLLPAPGGAQDLWHAYLSAWHTVGSGGHSAAPPYLALLAGLSTLTFGKPWLAVDLLLLGAVPLAGLSAYLASGTLTRNRWLRLWAGATYALLPVVTGAIATGRIDVTVATMALPLLLRGGVRTLRRDPRFAGWRTAVATGLGLSVAVAFAPVLWLLALVFAVIGCLVVRLGASVATVSGARRRCLAGLLAVAMPPALLLPWTITLVHHPGMLVAGVGRAAPDTVPDVAAHALLFANPGGPATPWAWLFAPLALVGSLALLRTGRRVPALAAWLVTVGGLATAVAADRMTVDLPGGLTTPVWAGIGTAIVGAGLVMGALVAADGASRSLRRRNFGWRQAGAGSLVVVALAVPLVAAGSWLHRGAGGPVATGTAGDVPAFVAADLATASRPRLLLLRQQGDTVRYTVQRGDTGPVLGDADVVLDDRAQQKLSALVARLAGGSGSDIAAGLASFDIRYVIVIDGNRGLSARLDRVPALARAGVDTVTLWRVIPRSGRVVVLPAVAAGQARAGQLPGLDDLRDVHRVSTGAMTTHARLAPGEPGRLLVLAEAASTGWHASLDGTPLRPVRAYGWAQGFELPAAGGRLTIDFHDQARSRWLALQVALVALALLFSLPTPARRDELGTPAPVAPSPPAGQAVNGAGVRSAEPSAPSETVP